MLRAPDLTLPTATLALVRPNERLRGGDSSAVGEVQLIAPLSCVIDANPPTFRWRGPTTDEYSVEVYDSRSRLLATSGPVHGLSWRPEQSFPLDELLHWRLGRRMPDGSETFYPTIPQPPAVLKTPSREALHQISVANTTGSKLLRGLALWEAGRLAEAAREFEALLQENPSSPVAGRLAASSSRGAAMLRSGATD